MDLTFQVTMQYCSFQHQTLLSPLDTAPAGCCFHFGSASSSLLELFLHSSPGAHWAPTNLGSSCLMSYLFAFSYCSWGSQGKNAGVVCHSLLQWTFVRTLHISCPSWVTLHSMAHSFIELGKVVVHVISLVSFLRLRFSFCLPCDG